MNPDQIAKDITFVDRLSALGDHIVGHLPTWIFLVITAFFLVHIFRLHLSNKYANFSLARFWTHADGSLDKEGFLVSSVFACSTYAFFHLLVKDPEKFSSYGPWWVVTWLGYIGYRMTTRPQSPPSAPPTLTEGTDAGTIRTP